MIVALLIIIAIGVLSIATGGAFVAFLGSIFTFIVVVGVLIWLGVQVGGPGPLLLLVVLGIVAIVISVAIVSARQAARQKRLEGKNSSSVDEVSNPSMEGWWGISPTRMTEIIEATLHAIYNKGISAIPKVRTVQSYCEELENLFQAASANSNEPFVLSDAILAIVELDNSADASVVCAIEAIRKLQVTEPYLPTEAIYQSRVPVENAHNIPSAGPHAAKNGPETRIVTSRDEQEEIVRVTLETVFELGVSSMPKTRSVPEYLREIERRWQARDPANRVPIRLSHAVLEVVRTDCVGHSKVMLALDRAMNEALPRDAILFH